MLYVSIYKRLSGSNNFPRADRICGVDFGATFFAITGLHLTHVVGGVIALTVVALGYKRGRYNSDDIEIWSLYWHFVDLVWMFVVPMVYLLNVAR